MKTVAEIVSAGPPKAGPPFVCTHDHRMVSLAETEGVLPFGFAVAGPDGRPGPVERGYSWHRFTGNVRIATGAAKASHRAFPGRAVAGILGASLQSLGPHKTADAIERAVMALPFSDVVTLLVARMLRRSKDAAPIHPATACLKCGELAGPTARMTPAHVRVAVVDWTPGLEPRAVVWLGSSTTYGGVTFDGVVVAPITWAALYGDAQVADFENLERTIVRSGAAAIVAVVDAKSRAVVDMPMPIDAAAGLLDEDAFNAISDAAFTVAGGAAVWTAVPCARACGGSYPVPFDPLTAAFA